MMLSLVALALAAAGEMPVTLHGIGELRIGMPAATLREMGAIRDENPLEEDGGDCNYWHLPNRDGLAFMVVGGRVVRIDIDNPAYRTASGAHVGMSEAAVRAIYGAALRVEPHPYTGPEGHYLILRARAEPYGLIFATNYENGRTESLRVGLWRYVQLIEGCA
ncbi:MAG: hypothetical protein QOJ53_636 [Sphingomonadales bacterium]|jgi:hypothetical protein|nr:hypothetical protein [Sphingomonadales bacterium]MEA3044424.1 hypothetical protein [Sphingomonadales bacterium]MEA3046304.1 hypothetical protein [Sphingomonadales bacterium]